MNLLRLFFTFALLSLAIHTTTASYWSCANEAASTFNFLQQLQKVVMGAGFSNAIPSITELTTHFERLKAECGPNFDISFSAESVNYQDCMKGLLPLFGQIGPKLTSSSNFLENVKSMYDIYRTLGNTLEPCGIILGKRRSQNYNEPSLDEEL